MNPEEKVRKASAAWAQPKPKPKPKKQPKPERPANLAKGRWLGDFGKLSALEKRLLKCVQDGEPLVVGDKRPEEDAAGKRVRAELIRFLMLGGDAQNPVHENGVDIYGAWISGVLDLNECDSSFQLGLFECHFAFKITARNAKLSAFYLNGSRVPSLNARGIKVAGGVFLRAGFEALGEVNLSRAEIGGNLACDKGSFHNCDKNGNFLGLGLNAQGIKVTGAVFLTDGFEARGGVRLTGARIGGQLVCISSKFYGTDNEGNAQRHAFTAENATVDGGFFFNPALVEGTISLTGCSTARLVDTPESWPSGNYFVHGFSYQQLQNEWDVRFRIDWLNNQAPEPSGEFRAHSWEQLSRVFRKAGHTQKANQIAIAKQEAMRDAGLYSRFPNNIMHALYGGLAGYGYRPLQLVGWLVFVWLFCGLQFHIGGQTGVFGPTDPVLTNPDIAAAITKACGHAGEVGKQYWTTCPAMPPEYSIFQPWLYSLDAILPLVDLQQEVDWSPVVENADGETLWFGAFLRWMMWFEILFGWTASLMLVAILGRLVEKD